MICLSVLLTLGGLELVLRVLKLPYTKTFLPPEYPLSQFDRELGWVYIPNSTKTQSFGSEQRPVAMYFDEIGARVGRLGVQLDRVAPTVLFVGGSFTMGHGLSYEETFTGQLEAKSNFPFQVVNLGVQAYGTDQSLLLMRRYFHRFNTRAVVYTFIEEHIRRNSNYDRREIIPNGHFIGTKPLLALDHDGSVYLKKKPALYSDLGYSRLLACLQIFWVARGPSPRLELTNALILEMKDFVESRGAVFLTVHWRQKPREVQGSFLRVLDLNLIDTAVDAPADWHQWLVKGDGHPDARAHAHVAGLISRRLGPQIAIESQSDRE